LNILDQIVNGMFAALDLVFKSRYVAPLIFLPVMLAAAGYLWWRASQRSNQFVKAADARIAKLKTALESNSDPNTARQTFAEDIGMVTAAMEETSPGSASLVRAWQEFRENLVDETEQEIRCTARPGQYFGHGLAPQRDLIFWSNTFVGIGLILTFLGIVVALNATAHGMREGASVQESQGALRDLLTIASVKFFASIAGLSASIMLRFADHGLSKKCELRIRQIIELLDRGLVYLPPPILAVRQMDELKRQTTQLEKFNTDLAISIGESVGQQFQTVMAPMQNSLGTLSASMETMSDRLSERFGEGVGRVIETATQGQLGALGQTLEALRAQLEGLSQHVQGSGEDAARQIRAAGADFAQAAQDIREAFSGLSGQVGEIGRAITSDTDTARARQAELLDATMAGLEAANARTADVMAKAADALRGAGTSVAADLQHQMGAAMTVAVRDAEGVIRQAITESGAAFAESGKEMIAAVEQAASRIAALSAAMEKSELHAGHTAVAFQASADSARQAAGSISDAAGGFAVAATPVATAARAFQEAAARISTSLDQSERAAAEALKAMTNLATEIGDTQSSAQEAWTSYRARFDGVDQSLERTLSQMLTAVTDSMGRFQEFAHNVDAEMASAVSRLSKAMATIEENSDSITQLAEAMRDRNTTLETV
jgi:hypothetical protein